MASDNHNVSIRTQLVSQVSQDKMKDQPARKGCRSTAGWGLARSFVSVRRVVYFMGVQKKPILNLVSYIRQRREPEAKFVEIIV